MKPRRGPSLFDVMSKAPIAQTPRERPKLSWFKRKVAAPFLSVAEPLTEEEAAAELAAQHPVELPEPRLPEPRETKLKVVEPTISDEPAATDDDLETPPILKYSNGRLTLNLTTPASVAVVGIVATIALAAYVAGQRTSSSRLPPVAARANNGETAPSPLLPAPASPPKKPSASDAAMRNPDLSHLLQRPTSAVNANKPANVAEEPTAARTLPGTPESLNYLQVESFLITRERSGDVLAQDVAEVRRFLHERGVRTFARKRSNGFVLFAEQGFAPGRATAQDRAAFQRKIEQLGQEYRSAGGRYQFKGCLFVSYSSTKAGEPV
jgi:hypothetical protein